jgi:DNA-binding NarL/FixJ family response regulator
MSDSECGRTAVLLDQHPLWLDAVEQVLGRAGVEVVGKATSRTAAARLIEEHRPELLIAEIASDDDGDGKVWLRETTARFHDLKVIILSMADSSEDVAAAFAAGAVAYVIKKAHPDDLAVAVRQAFEHSIYLPSRRGDQPARLPVAPVDLPDLTRRELEILRLAAEGLSNAELAKRLWVTEQTVKFHLSNIYRKLDVSNRTEASRWAQINGLLPVGPPVPAGVPATLSG